MATIKRFEEIISWQEARELNKMLGALIDTGRFKNNFRLINQIEGSAGSIMDNIAEGFESGSDAAFVRYLQIAKGSCAEVKSMLFLCEDFHICTSEERIKLHAHLYEISSGIYKLIQFLIKNKG